MLYQRLYEVKLWLRFSKKRTAVSCKDKKNCKYIILRTSIQKQLAGNEK